MTRPSSILSLSNELLREVLDHIEADPEKLMNLDRRSYLSQESFKAPPPVSLDQAQDIGHFRLTCKRFCELGAIHQFARVTTRFSGRGLERLEKIANQPHLAKHVKKFSYMVPYFYVEGRERVREVLPGLQESFGALDVTSFLKKVKEQREIVRSEEDVRVLKAALSAFTSLQHVQILRLQDHEDGILLGYIRQHDDLTRLVELKWAPACSHSTKTIGAAILASHSPCSRFSYPMLSPHSVTVLAQGNIKTISLLAHQLTSLELHFDDGTDLDNRMMELSSIFKTVFTAAKNMQAIHLGFPSHRPLSIRLDTVFHHVKWDRLCAFGIQAWKLEAEEIMSLVGRHREKLRGLRLRDVLLKDGSMWKDVLAFLHDDMIRLDWVSLRRIGYAKHFDEQWADAGAEVPDDPPGGASDSDDVSDRNDYDSDSEDQPHGLPGPSNTSDALSNDPSQDFSENSETDEEDRSEAHAMNFPHLSPNLLDALPSSSRAGQASKAESAEDLGDNGTFVSNLQRKAWETWVVRHTVRHASGAD